MRDWKTDVVGLKRIEIPEHDGWIEIRKELSIGESKAIDDATFKGIRQLPDGSVLNEMRISEAKFKRALTYIVNWSIPVEPSLEVIQQLPIPLFTAIDEAIDKYVKESTAKKPKAARTTKEKLAAVPISTSA